MRRVAPPTSTIANTSAATHHSQARTIRARPAPRCAADDSGASSRATFDGSASDSMAGRMVDCTAFNCIAVIIRRRRLTCRGKCRRAGCARGWRPYRPPGSPQAIRRRRPPPWAPTGGCHSTSHSQADRHHPAARARYRVVAHGHGACPGRADPIEPGPRIRLLCDCRRRMGAARDAVSGMDGAGPRRLIERVFAAEMPSRPLSQPRRKPPDRVYREFTASDHLVTRASGLDPATPRCPAAALDPAAAQASRRRFVEI